MIKRYVFEVFADTQEAAENRLKEEVHTKYYLVTTEPVTEPIRAIREAQKMAHAQYEEALRKDCCDEFRAYKMGYKDALDMLMRVMEGKNNEAIS